MGFLLSAAGLPISVQGALLLKGACVTCALCGAHQALPEHLSHPGLQGLPALAPLHRHHQVGGGQPPVGRHQRVDHLWRRVTRQPQELASRTGEET